MGNITSATSLQFDFKQIFKAAPTPYLLVLANDPEFTIYDVNDAYLSSTNSKQADLINVNVFEAFPIAQSDDSVSSAKLLLQSFRTVISTHASHSMETLRFSIPIRGTNEYEERFWDIVNTPLFNSDGSVQYILNSVQDVTKKLLDHNVSDLIAKLNDKGEYVYMSSASYSVFGMDPDSFMGRHFFDFIHPDDYDRVKELFVTIENQPKTDIDPYRFKQTDGNWRWIETKVSNKMDDPSIKGYILNSRDVNDSRHFLEVDRLEKLVLEKNARPDSVLADVLDFYLRGIEQLYGDMICSIMRVTDNRIYAWAAPRLPQEYLDSLNGLEIGPDHGSCGTAAFTGKTVIVSDITTDYRWERYRKTAHQYGLKSCWSTPVFNTKNEVIATFAIYYHQEQSPIVHENNLIARASNLLQIIIENKLIESTLADTLQLYNLVNKATNDAIYDWDINANTVIWGDGFSRLFGHARTDYLDNTNWVKLVHPDDYPIIQEGIRLALHDVNTHHHNTEYRLLTIHGKYAHVIENGYIVRDNTGAATRMIGVLRDITYRKHQELENNLMLSIGREFISDESLSESLRGTLDHILHYINLQYGEIWIPNIDGKSVVLTAYKQLEHCKPTNHVLRYPLLEGLFGRVWSQKKAIRFNDLQNDTEFLRHDFARECGWKSSLAIPVLFNDAVIAVILLFSQKAMDDQIFNDLSPNLLGQLASNIQRKKAEQMLYELNEKLNVRARELALSNAELEQFAYVASHDLQEPLRMVTGFLTQLEKKYGTVLDEKGIKYIAFAVDGAKRMRNIILDLLEFSKASKLENNREEVSIELIIHEIKLLYRHEIKESKADIKTDHLPVIVSIHTPIRQVFQNLVSNALKYHQKDIRPIIQINAEETPFEWLFSVSDNGIGIEKEYYDKIFIMFQRLHDRTTYDGTGMGLAITKKIVDNLGGRIWVDSELEKGTTFYFTIPKGR